MQRMRGSGKHTLRKFYKTKNKKSVFYRAASPESLLAGRLISMQITHKVERALRWENGEEKRGATWVPRFLLSSLIVCARYPI